MASAAAVATRELDSGAAATETVAFYDSLAPDYQAIFADWDASVKRQGVCECTQ